MSYVLNNVTNQTIPEETKCRVFEAAKQLNYVPNLAARSLVKQKSGLIGILINKNEDDSIWQQLRYSQFVSRLEKLLSTKGYHVVLFSLDASDPKLDIISERKLDGVFVVDVKTEYFHLISSYFSSGVPLIVIDSIIDDPLFYKVNYDYSAAFSHALTTTERQHGYLIVDSFNNSELVDHICNSSGIDQRSIHILTNESQLQAFLSQNDHRPGIILNEFAALAAAKFTDPAKFTVICTADCPEILPPSSARVAFQTGKAEVALKLMLQLLANPMQGPENKYLHVKPAQS